MNSGRFFLPGGSAYFNPFIRSNYNRIGMFSRIFSSIKRFNWNGLLNEANKTLNVVNQTIPLVRQAGPMVNNMKNMFKIAKAFGNETNHNSKVNNVTKNPIINDNIIIEKNNVDGNYPSFFV